MFYHTRDNKRHMHCILFFTLYDDTHTKIYDFSIQNLIYCHLNLCHLFQKGMVMVKIVVVYDCLTLLNWNIIQSWCSFQGGLLHKFFVSCICMQIFCEILKQNETINCFKIFLQRHVLVFNKKNIQILHEKI